MTLLNFNGLGQAYVNLDVLPYLGRYSRTDSTSKVYSRCSSKYVKIRQVQSVPTTVASSHWERNLSDFNFDGKLLHSYFTTVSDMLWELQ
jgi:hypothetical protein